MKINMLIKYITDGINHFIHFHKGVVNILLHIVGFAGIFYSIFKLDWKMFAVFLVIVEVGHFYNHITGIEDYDMGPKVLFWRVAIFLLLITTLYLVRNYL